MGGSSSSSSTSSTNHNTDGRVATDNGGIGISSQGNVHLNVVADEAFELGQDAVRRAIDSAENIAQLGHENGALLSRHLAENSELVVGSLNKSNERVHKTLSDALVSTQQAGKSEAGQISEQLIKIGIPAAALAFAAASIFKK
jgi:hypothetical protein